MLRIQPTGKMTFYYSYRNDQGKRKRIKIGALDSSLTIQQARDQAVRFAANVVAGKDIQAEKTDTRQKENEKKLRTLERFGSSCTNISLGRKQTTKIQNERSRNFSTTFHNF